MRKQHPILSRPWEYDIVQFTCHLDQNNPENSFIEMALKKQNEEARLRFHQPTNLSIEKGFPQGTSGMIFYDTSSDQLEDIGIEVSDFEATSGAIEFSAKSVVTI